MAKLVYHYTTLDALYGIIKKDRIILRATKYKHLNDPFEKIWSQKFIQSQIKQELGKDQPLDVIEGLVNRHPFIISFCKKPDYRNMWRLYCNDGLGICIGFNAMQLRKIATENFTKDPKGSQDFFEHVYYCSRKDVQKAFEYWERKSVFNMNKSDKLDNLYATSTFIKCNDFKIEKEIRYVRLRENCSVNLNYNSSTEEITTEIKEDVSKVQYRMRNKEKVPFLEISFPSEIVKEIIVGYGYGQFEDVKECIEQILKPNKSLKKVAIKGSSLNKDETSL